MWPDAYGSDLFHISFLDITKQKPEYTWLAGAITWQAHIAFPVKFLFVNLVFSCLKGMENQKREFEFKR